jgi:hypothetical protein
LLPFRYLSVVNNVKLVSPKQAGSKKHWFMDCMAQESKKQLLRNELNKAVISKHERIWHIDVKP